MQAKSQSARRRAEARLAAWSLAIAIPVFAFGAIAEDIVEDEPFAFDRTILLALRAPGNPATPIGPAWLPEAARDVTSLGSTTVLGLLLFSLAGYLLLERRRAAAGLILGAVTSGVVLNNLLKLAIGRPRPDVASSATQVFTSSFPKSGQCHALGDRLSDLGGATRSNAKASLPITASTSWRWRYWRP